MHCLLVAGKAQQFLSFEFLPFGKTVHLSEAIQTLLDDFLLLVKHVQIPPLTFLQIGSPTVQRHTGLKVNDVRMLPFLSLEFNFSHGNLEGSPEGLSLFLSQNRQQPHFPDHLTLLRSLLFLPALLKACNDSLSNELPEDGKNQHEDKHQKVRQDVAGSKNILNPSVTSHHR